MDLVLHDLQKQFSVGGDIVVALNSVSLSVPNGQFVTVMGSNGAGKSTMLGAVAGSVLVDSGEISLGTHTITRMSESKRARLIGRVFQDPRIGTAPSLTVAENIALARLRPNRRTLRTGVSSKLRKEILDRLEECELTDLCNRLNQRVGTLSGGQRQAISLMMATWNHPDLLLLDEHTAALDPRRAASIMSLTARIQASAQLTVLMVTHDVAQAVEYGDRLIMMDQGRIIEDLSGDQKQSLTFDRIIELFHEKGMAVDDRTLLSHEEQ